MKTKQRMKISLLVVLGVMMVLDFGCTTNDPSNSDNINSLPTVKDIDGNTYHIITIGTQTWMVENLKTHKYNDGTDIPLVSDGTAWSKLSTPGYCANTYGALYNWYTVNTLKLAPTGWHVPSYAEWTTLHDYVNANLGTSGTVAKAIAAKSNWSSDTSLGAIGNDLTKNNSSGFNALPGGFRDGTGTFYGFGYMGLWWCSTQDYLKVNAQNLFLKSSDSEMTITTNPKTRGMAVRCIKD